MVIKNKEKNKPEKKSWFNRISIAMHLCWSLYVLCSLDVQQYHSLPNWERSFLHCVGSGKKEASFLIKKPVDQATRELAHGVSLADQRFLLRTMECWRTVERFRNSWEIIFGRVEPQHSQSKCPVQVEPAVGCPN